MKRKKLTLEKKKKIFRGTFDPASETKYARKKRMQQQGIISPASPLRSNISNDGGNQ
jgi:hypothetical protein